DVEMIEVAALGVVTHFELGIARELVAEENATGIALETPGIILEGAEIEVIEAVGTGFAMNAIFQFPLAVLVPEKEAKGVLGIAGAAAETAADADASIDLKTLGAIR